MKLALLTFSAFAAVAQAASVGTCAGSAAVTNFQILAERPEGGRPIPLRALNELKPQTRLVYKPGPSERSKKAEIGLVLVTDSGLTVLETRRANQPASWTVTNRTQVVGLVYGPQGLDEKKVGKLVRQDSELIEQLAQFAEKTTQTEAVIEALMSPDPGGEPRRHASRRLRPYSRNEAREEVDFQRASLGAAPSADARAVDL